jgi:hypothetical protein
MSNYEHLFKNFRIFLEEGLESHSDLALLVDIRNDAHEWVLFNIYKLNEYIKVKFMEAYRPIYKKEELIQKEIVVGYVNVRIIDKEKSLIDANGIGEYLEYVKEIVGSNYDQDIEKGQVYFDNGLTNSYLERGVRFFKEYEQDGGVSQLKRNNNMEYKANYSPEKLKELLMSCGRDLNSNIHEAAKNDMGVIDFKKNTTKKQKPMKPLKPPPIGKKFPYEKGPHLSVSGIRKDVKKSKGPYHYGEFGNPGGASPLLEDENSD